jgi:NOL1/NOP2/fmu family ribosome biogenesis protein
VIRKTGTQDSGHIKTQKKQELRPGKNDLDVANDWTGIPNDRLLKWNGEVFAVPCEMEDYLQLFQNLQVVQPGTKLFTIKNNDYLPSHELALSDNLKNAAFPREEISLSEAISYLRRDVFTLNNASKGWNIVTYKDINLGFVKNLGNRLNNYFPVEWRIRMDLPAKGSENIICWD